MEPSSPIGSGYKVWGADQAVYGPVELPVLVSWIKDERVTPVTWVYSEREDAWRRAKDLPELAPIFSRPTSATAQGSGGASAAGAVAAIKPGSLRRIKILADLTEEQLETFVKFTEIESVRQWAEIVKQGQAGDAMYLLLEGELRVRLMISGKETIIVTLGPGEFFGEACLFDHGPRSADVIANKDSILLKVSEKNFQRLLDEAPKLAAPFLFAMGKSLTARIRADNKRYRDSVNFARTASAK
jgi:CRP-like cAMP-binding protein